MIRNVLKSFLPEFALEKYREIYFRHRKYSLIRRKYDGGSIQLRTTLWPKKTVLFYPDLPREDWVSFKLCALLGYAITNDPTRGYDVAFKRKDKTFFNADELAPIKANRIINAQSTDISKEKVGQVFEEVFGYSLSVDPTIHGGPMVVKSNENAAHDGRIIEGPISQPKPNCVYQKVIDTVEDNNTLDHRVPIHGRTIPLVYLKYRPIETRFSNVNSFVELADPSLFSEGEQRKIISFAKRMGMDYAELDVLRDKDERIYIVDANTTPHGPPNGLPVEKQKIALARLSKSFKRLVSTAKQLAD